MPVISYLLIYEFLRSAASTASENNSFFQSNLIANPVMWKEI